MTSTISKLPEHSGDGYGFGGGYIVNCPVIRRLSQSSLQVTDEFIALNLGEIQITTAEFLRDAINEKLDRDFTNSG